MVEGLECVGVVMRNEHDAGDGAAMPRVAQVIADALLECSRGMLEEIPTGATSAGGVRDAGRIALPGERQPELNAGEMAQHAPGILGAVPAHCDAVNVSQLEALAAKAPGHRVAGEQSTRDLQPGEPLLLAESPHHAVAHQTGRWILAEGADPQDIHPASAVLTAGKR
jgi:hypothetical protein